MIKNQQRLAWTGLLFLAACADPTEVVVFVDTNLGVPCEVDTFRISVQGAGEAEQQDVPAADGQVSWTILKDSGGNGFTVNVAGLKDGREVATALANVQFAAEASRQVNVVLSRDCMETPCDFTPNVVPLAGPVQAVRDTCEGRASRYTLRNQAGLIDVIDACALQAGPFQSFTGMSNSEAPVDDATLADVLLTDFDFRLYGERVDQVWISDDGFLSFGTAPTNSTFDRVTNTEGLTSPGHPTFAVAAFWDNLELHTTGQICVAMQQAGDRNTLWATWKNACLGPACAPADILEFSVGLEEDTNRVTIGFEQMLSDAEPDRAAGGQAVVGIVGSNEPACAASECSAEGLCADGTTPCGFGQAFSREIQMSGWPAAFVFDPVPDQ